MAQQLELNPSARERNWPDVRDSLKRSVEGFHSSYLEGLRHGPGWPRYERSRRAVEAVGNILRLPEVRSDASLRRWRADQKVRWTAYHKVLEALEG